MDKEKTYKAALILIGDEILSGRTKDKNLSYIAENLNEYGIQLAEVRVIPDDEHEIIETTQTLSAKFDYVFTTGGIGPTHDDITSECIGKAFGKKCVLNPDAVKMLEDYYLEGQVTPARLKMAMVPEGSTLIPNPVSGAPGFKLENVHVMAGVPKIMQGMLHFVLPSLAGGKKVVSRTVEGNTGESMIADRLTEIVNAWPSVSIGSYPAFKNAKPSVSLVARSTSEEDLDKVIQELYALFESVDANPHIVENTLPE